MTLAEDKVFLEETILVSRQDGSSRDLQQRLCKRMEALGVVAREVLEEERAEQCSGGIGGESRPGEGSSLRRVCGVVPRGRFKGVRRRNSNKMKEEEQQAPAHIPSTRCPVSPREAPKSRRPRAPRGEQGEQAAPSSHHPT